MLTSIELQLQLSVILGLLHLYRLEQVPDIVFCQEGTAQYSHDFIDASVEFKRSFNDCNSAVRDDSHINLYSYSILCVSPCGEPHGVISEDIICTFQKVFSVHHLKLWSSFFPYDEERVEHLDTVQPVQIPVATVKNIAGKRLVINPVHGIHIMNGSFCDIERYRNLGHYIKLCVYLDAGLGASESCSFKKRHTEVYGSGIKGIVLPVEFKLLEDTLLLGKFYHMIGKFFKDMIITKLIHSGQLRSVNGCPTKTKVKGFLGVCGSYVNKFTKTVAAIQLTEHKNEHLVPVCQIPSLGSIVTSCHDKSFEVSFGKEIGNLTEKVFAAVHCTLLLGSPTKVTSSKVRQGFWQYTY